MASSEEAPARPAVKVRQVAPIEFGTFTAGHGGGSIAIDAKTGGRSLTGDASALGGNYGQAEFEISGQPAQEVIVHLPEEIALDNKNGAGSLALTRLTAEPSGILTLNEFGKAKVTVGGTLRLGPRASQGQYSGYFDLNAQYVRN